MLDKCTEIELFIKIDGHDFHSYIPFIYLFLYNYSLLIEPIALNKSYNVSTFTKI